MSEEKPMKVRKTRYHVPLRVAAALLGHQPRWIKDRIAAGELEGFRHAKNDITVSMESIQRYEDLHAMR